MTTDPICHMYTRDGALAARVVGILSNVARVQRHDTLERLGAILEGRPALALVDLRDRASVKFLTQAAATWPESVFIALSELPSEPAIAIEEVVYAVEDIGADHRHLRNTIRRALHTLALKVENACLRRSPQQPPTEPPVSPRAGFTSLLYGASPGRGGHPDTVEAFLDNAVGRLVDTGAVSRAGVFGIGQNASRFRLRAARRVLPATRQCEYGPGDAITRWMAINCHMISIGGLGHIADPSDRALLHDSLSSWGADAAVPLHARDRLLGWIFFGRSATGEAFSKSDMADLVLFSEQVASGLERALLHEQISIRQTLLNTLLGCLPIGIVATGTDGLVQYLNRAARDLLALPGEATVGGPISQLGNRVADLVNRALRDPTPTEMESRDMVAGRVLRVRARPLRDGDTNHGAVALVEDVTAERIAAERDIETERAQVWSDLARGLSQEIRNSLVAFSVYAQLLPERHADSQFLGEFARAVPREVERLTRLVEKIGGFASVTGDRHEPLEIGEVIASAIEIAKRATDGSAARVSVDVAESLPRIRGNRPALVECLIHAIVNALEACEESPTPEVAITARATNVSGQPSGILIVVRDNGPGIPDHIAAQIFSPFCTTKDRGLGLGLPVVRRTVVDHGGKVEVQTGARGTSLRIALPSETVMEAHHD